VAVLVISQSLCAQSADRSGTAAATPAPVTRSLPPLTAGRRIDDAFKAAFGPLAFVSSAAAAGVGQWRGKPEEWKQGAAGYGRRYASSFATRIVREGITLGVAGALHEDNRYVPSGSANKKQRLEYAIESTFLARLPDGRRRVSYSRFAGWMGAAAISRSWQPEDSRTVRSGIASLGVSIGVAAGFRVAREFLPRFFH